MGKASFMRLLEPDSSLADVRNTFVERLDHMFQCEEKSGCLVVFTAMEMAPRDSEIEDVLRKLLLRMSKTYAVGLAHARDKGEVREDLDLQQAGHFLTGAFFGMSVMARCGFSRQSLDAYVATTIAAVAEADH
jgi:hypothetical protein